MTVAEALQMAKALRPTATDEAVKLRWLSELEGRIGTEVIGKAPEVGLSLVGRAAAHTCLTAPLPYDRLYWTYLVAMEDLAAADTAAYQVSFSLFSEAYDAYARWYQRTKGGRM